jgi:hypothetical protein
MCNNVFRPLFALVSDIVAEVCSTNDVGVHCCPSVITVGPQFSLLRNSDPVRAHCLLPRKNAIDVRTYVRAYVFFARARGTTAKMY